MKVLTTLTGYFLFTLRGIYPAGLYACGGLYYRVLLVSAGAKLLFLLKTYSGWLPSGGPAGLYPAGLGPVLQSPLEGLLRFARGMLALLIGYLLSDAAAYASL